MAQSRGVATDDDLDDSHADESDVEVERMPDLDGWEFFRAIDEGDERWLLALRYDLPERAFEYSFWTDPKKEPDATGRIDAREEKKAPWSKALRSAAKRAPHEIDDDTRAEIISWVLELRDPTLHDYADRLSFSIGSVDTDEDEDEDDVDEEDA